MTKGYVYILTNEAMPGLVKIGKTTRDPASRAVELHQTGVPYPFVVAVSVLTPDCHELERDIHSAMSDCRVRSDREFFRCDLGLAERSLSDCHREQMEMWLDEFMPGHYPVEGSEVVDIGNISDIAASHDIHLYEMVHAYSFLMPDDVIGAVERMRAHVKSLRAARLAGTDNGGYPQ